MCNAMENIQETQILLSNAFTSNLVPTATASEVEQMLCATDDPSFYRTFRDRKHAVKKPVVGFKAAL